MIFNDRIMDMFRHEDTSLRSVSLLFGLNLILAGIIIFVFPEILVFLISMAFIAAGVSVIAGGWRRRREVDREEYVQWDR